MTLHLRRDETASLRQTLRPRRPARRRWALALGFALAGYLGLTLTKPGVIPGARLLQGIPQAFAHASAAPVRCGERPAELQQDLSGIAQAFDGKVGIAVTQAGCNWMVGERLDEPITLRPEDQVVFNQPLRWTVLKQGSLTLPTRQLMADALSLSDNMANDKLLWRIGGPDHVRTVLAQRGISGVRFGPGERLLQSQIARLTWTPDLAIGFKFEEERAKLPIGLRKNLLSAYIDDPLDGATPAGITGALGKLARGDLLSLASTDVLLGIMQHSKSGPMRLKGAVPPGWTVYHKTGTGQELAGIATAYNDVAIFQAPDGTRYAVAVMIGETRLPIKARMEMMQAVSRAVGAAHERRSNSSG